MTDSRAFLLGEVERQQGGDGGVAPSDVQQGHPNAPVAESEVDDQEDEEQAPWAADQPFFDALTPAAQQDLENGVDMSAEWAAWTSGEVGTGPSEPDLPTFELELPMSGDECQEQADLWGAIAAAGGDDETSAEDAIAFADAWRLQARATALAEYRAGRRRDLDLLHPDDLNRAVQAEVDRRTEEGRQRYGRQRGDRDQ